MATYAPVPRFAERKAAPRTLMIIVAGHAALLAAVMTAKIDFTKPFIPQVTEVVNVPLPDDPPPLPPEPQKQTKNEPAVSTIDRMPVIVPTPPVDNAPRFDPTPMPTFPLPDPIIGSGQMPRADPLPVPAPVKTGPRFATPDHKLRPPYPEAKRASDEEASLRLRLSIDARGRVIAVEPVGRSDPHFLASARRHLLAHWRYEPATEDGRPVASSTVITLTFQLDD